MRYELPILLSISACMVSNVSSFTGPVAHIGQVSSLQLGSKLFDDGIGNSGEGDESSDRNDLTKKFFEEVRARESSSEQQESTDREATAIPGSTTKEEPLIGRIDEPSNSNFNPEISDSAPLPKKKFTGQRDSYFATPSPISNVGRQSSPPRTPREMMMEREYNLVGRAERNIAVQAVFAVLALAFYIYIGMSGGIVSGNDAARNDFGGDDEIYFEEIMPIQKDREVSVWL